MSRFYWLRKLGQRVKNGGFPDEHLFEMGYHLCKWVQPRLKMILQQGPQGWPDNEQFPTMEKYKEALQDIQFFVDHWIASDEYNLSEKDLERFERGWKLSYLLFTYWD